MKDRIVGRRGLFGILVLSAMLAVLSVSAYDHDQTYNANAVYFVPEDVRISEYCQTQTVEIWANVSVPIASGRVVLNYTCCCANITDIVIDKTNFEQSGEANYGCGWANIPFLSATGHGPGKVHICDITIHCCNETIPPDCCGTELIFDNSGTGPAGPFVCELIDTSFQQLPNVNWANGTFLCGDAIEVTKTVWDGSNWVDALGPLGSEWMGKDVRFNITVRSKCLDLSSVVVSDVMDDSLEYNNSADPSETSNTTHTATWNIGALPAGTSTSIEFNATIVGYGTDYNTATATATVTDLGIDVTAQDQASVTTMPPAGIDVTKMVWDPARGEWVEEINSTLDYLDIGNPISEAGRLDMVADDWSYIGSPSCTGSNCLPSGSYGGYDGGSADFRGLMGPPTGCGSGHEHATFTMDAGAGYATELVLRHLDGSQNDSFDVFIVEDGDDTYIGHYEFSGNTNEYWTTTTFNFAPRTGVIKFKLVATDPQTTWCNTWGQVMINWAELRGNRAQIGDTFRFRCEMHNSGSPGMDLTDIRFWDRMSCSLEYADNATLTTPNGVTRDIELPGNFVFKPKYLHATTPVDIYDPISSSWHELWPEYCNEYDLTSWHDNGDGYLSECDQIDMTANGEVAWYHVDRVIFTLWVENEETGDEMYLDSEVDYDPAGLLNPVGAWHEIYPDFCKEWLITDWEDTNSNDEVDYCDYVYMVNLHDCGQTGWYHVLGVTIDLEVSREWLIDDWLQDPLTLQPCQTVTIEFDATVVDYGYDCNVQYAKGWCEEVGEWVYGEDDACIDTPKPDLNVTDITVNYDLCSAGVGRAFGPTDHPGHLTQDNKISADITELNGVDVLFPFNVTFEIDGTPVCTVRLPGLAAGATETVYCDDQFHPIAGVTYTITVTVDPLGEIPETDEGNNALPEDITAGILGYKGNHYQDGRNITTLQCHEEGTINLVYSPGDSYYLSRYYNPDWTTYEANWTPSDLPMPATETCIKKARLYVYYNWDKSPGRNITDYFEMDFNGYTIPIDRHYSDIKWPGHYPYGMLAYDVANAFSVTGNNTATLTNTYPGGGMVSMDGMLLVVVYNHSSEPHRIIWINEGYDMLRASTTGYSYNYGVSSEEATAYANFTGCEPIPMDKVVGANLITVATHASDGDDYNRLYFNDGEWHGVWDSYPPTPPLWPWRLGISHFGAPQLGMNETDVTIYLEATDNEAAFQSHIPDGGDHGDGLEAANAFLIVTEGEPGMSVEPEPPETGECYRVNEEFDVLINITPRGMPIMGAQFDLHFNASVLQAETVTYGDFLLGEGSVYVSHSDIDNVNGVVSFAAARQGTTNGVTDPGTFAIVSFTAVTQGETSELDLYDALASDNSTPVQTIELVTTNGTADVCSNIPPVAVARSDFIYNNIAERGLSKAYFNGTESEDPDGIITNWRWWVDDGTDLIGMRVEHLFEVPMYWQGDQSGYYVPAEVTLRVTDDGMPLMDSETTIPVTVWIGGDVTGDGRVNIADAVTFGMQFGAPCNINGDGLRWYDNPYGDMADLNNDEHVNIGDAMLIGTCWGHTAW